MRIIYLFYLLSFSFCNPLLARTIPSTDSAPISIVSTTNKATCGLATGGVDIHVSGGVGPYSFLWSTGDVTEDLVNVVAGTYTVTVTDAVGETATHTATVADDNVMPPILSTRGHDEGCSPVHTGFIELNMGPNYPQTTFEWSNGETTEDVYGLPSNAYAVTVTLGSCQVVRQFINNGKIHHYPVYPYLSIDFDNATCGSPNGSVNINVSSSFDPFTFLWSNGETTEDLMDVVPGHYEVTVTGVNGCSETAEAVVSNNNPGISVSAFTFPATSCLISNGSIDASATPPNSTYSYTWSNGATTEDLSGLSPGSYEVTVTQGEDCTAAAAFIVADALHPSVTISVSPATCGLNNGLLLLSVTGAPPFTYDWAHIPGINNPQNLSNIGAGTYAVTITNALGCSTEESAVVSNVVPFNISGIQTNHNSCIAPDGSIDVSISPPNGGNYSYTWSTGATTQDLTGLLPGTYSLIVRKDSTCASTAVFNVATTTITPSLSITATTAYCGQSNGALSLDLGAGMPPYSFLWSNMASTEDLVGVPPGIYSITVTDSVGCKAMAFDTVPNNIIAVNLAIASTGNTSCVLFNGGLNMSVLPLGVYTFSWSNGATTEDLVNMPAGTYTVLATNANGCSATVSGSVPDNTPAINIGVVSMPNNNCVAANGGLDISVSPSGNYTFNWSNAATTEDLTNIVPANYSVTASDANGCTATVFATVLDNTIAPQLDATALAAICNQNNGSIDITTTGGTSPYLFEWSNAATTEDIDNVFPGNYSLTVTDANGCSTDMTLNVANNANTFSITGASSPLNDCASLNGAVDLTVTPTGAYTYIWSGGQTTEDLVNLPSGTYTVQVTESGSCIASATFFVPNALNYPGLNQNIIAERCNLFDGSIDLSVLGGLAPFNFNWASGQTTEDLSNIASGNYAVTVTDANNCTDVATVNVPENTFNFSLAGTATPNSACAVPNGSIDLGIAPAIPNGSPDYTYTWSNGFSTQDINSVPAGNYVVTVSAGGTCVNTASFTIDNTATMAVGGNGSNVLCFGENTGAIDLIPSGGTQPFNFNWSPNLGNVEDPANLIAGNYAVTVTDALGCSAMASFNVSQPAAPVQVTCTVLNIVSQPGFQDGNADVQIAGGAAPYSVSWNPGGVLNGILTGVLPLQNLAVGNYSVTVTDANGCTSVCGFSIDLVSCLSATGSMGTAQLSSCGKVCVTAVYDAQGQILGANDLVQFVLHEGSGALIVNELARSSLPTFCFAPTTMAYGTTYYISAVAGGNDGSGNVNLAHFCSVVSTGTPVVFHEKPVAGVALPHPITCATVQIGLFGSSSIPNSTFQWSTPNGNILGGTAQADIESDKAGDYTLVVNSNGCTDTTETTLMDIRNDPSAKISASPDDMLDCIINEIVLTGEANNTNTVWMDMNGAIYPTGTLLTIVSPGTHQFVILDTLTFCTDTATIIINQNQLYPPLFVNPPATLTCAIGSVTLSGGSSVSGVLFEWASVNGADTVVVGNGPNVTVTQPNEYLLIGTDPLNGCHSALSVTVAADQSFPTASAGAPFSMDCFGQTISLNGSATGGTGVLTYHWTSSDGLILSGSNTPAPMVGEPGTYLLLVTSTDNGCSDTDMVTISPKEPVASAVVGQPSCFGQKGTILIDTVLGAKPPIHYSLTGGPHVQMEHFFSNLEAGPYTVLIEDASGCTTSVGATIVAPAVFEVTVEPAVTVQWGDSYQVDATVNVPQSEIAQVFWSPSTWLSCDTCLSTHIIAPLSNQQYQIMVVTKSGCRDEAELRLQVHNSVNVYIPNIFSPNEDGKNDGFTVFADLRGVKQVKLFQIYSRWGEQVFVRENFQPNDPSLGWDGRFRGVDMNPAVFVYNAIVELIDGQQVVYNGDVTVER